MVKSVWPEKEKSPLLVAVSTGYQPEWLTGFLGKNVGADAVAHHLYSLGSAVDERAYEKMFNASHLQRVTALAAKVRTRGRLSLARPLSPGSHTQLLRRVPNARQPPYGCQEAGTLALPRE